MILIALFVGIVLIVAAIRNSQSALFTALGQDVPAFIVWGAALFAVGAIGFVPGLKPISRGLLALVLIVIILNNYQNILNGFQSLADTRSGSSNTSKSSGGTTASSSSASSSPTSSTLGNAAVSQSILDQMTDPTDLESFFYNAMGAG